MSVFVVLQRQRVLANQAVPLKHRRKLVLLGPPGVAAVAIRITIELVHAVDQPGQSRSAP